MSLTFRRRQAFGVRYTRPGFVGPEFDVPIVKGLESRESQRVLIR